MDISGDTVTADDLLLGVTAHGADGNPITGAVVTAPIDDTLTVQDAAADAKVVGDALHDIVSDAWDSDTTYSVGDIRIFDNVLYKCLIGNRGQRPSVSVDYWEATNIISEIGNVAGNNWLRFANGIQMCWDEMTVNVSAVTAWGALYESETIELGTMPIVYKSRPTVFAFLGHDSAGGGLARVTNSSTTSWGETTYYRPTSSSTQITINLLAVGRWK